MTDMPERIWIDDADVPRNEKHSGPYYIVDDEARATTEYVSLDHANAMVGAAIAQILSGPVQRCHKCDCQRGGLSCKWILPNDKPLDAQAALEDTTQRARAEGYQQALADAAGYVRTVPMTYYRQGVADPLPRMKSHDEMADEILTLKDKSHE